MVSLHLSALFKYNQFSDFFRIFVGGGGGGSEHVQHLGFLLRTVLIYDAYAETPV